MSEEVKFPTPLEAAHKGVNEFKEFVLGIQPEGLPHDTSTNKQWKEMVGRLFRDATEEEKTRSEYRKIMYGLKISPPRDITPQLLEAYHYGVYAGISTEFVKEALQSEEIWHFSVAFPEYLQAVLGYDQVQRSRR